MGIDTIEDVRTEVAELFETLKRERNAHKLQMQLAKAEARDECDRMEAIFIAS